MKKKSSNIEMRSATKGGVSEITTAELFLLLQQMVKTASATSGVAAAAAARNKISSTTFAYKTRKLSYFSA